jgi:uncharacterized Rmd1/YagE family protein
VHAHAIYNKNMDNRRTDIFFLPYGGHLIWCFDNMQIYYNLLNT